MFLFGLYSIYILFTLFSINNSRKQQLQIVFVLCLLTFFFTGTRWEFGGDWDSYYGYFNSIKSLDFNGNSFQMDYGWVFFSYLIKTIFSSYVAFQFFIAGIIFFSIYNGIKSLSYVPILSYLIYFSMQNGGIGYVRTTVAATVFLYSYKFVAKKQLVPFLVTALFAASIHFAAIVAIPIYWVYWNHAKYYKYLIVFILSTSTFYVFGRLFISDVSFLGPFLEYKISNYSSLQESGQGAAETVSLEAAMLSHIVKKSVTFYLLIVLCRKYYATDTFLRGMTNVYIAGSIFYCSLAPLSLQFSRMSPLMDSVEIYLYAYIYSKLHNRQGKLFLLVAIIFMGFIRMRGHILPDPLYYNYHNILFY